MEFIIITYVNFLKIHYINYLIITANKKGTLTDLYLHNLLRSFLFLFD